MKRSTMIIITVLNLVAVGYMGFLVFQLYHRPKPQVGATPARLDPPSVESTLQTLEAAGSLAAAKKAIRQLPAPLEGEAAAQVIDWLLAPGAFDYLRASQKIVVRDLLIRKVAHPDSLTPEHLQRLSAAVQDADRDLIDRQTIAGLIFDAALAQPAEGASETNPALPVAIELIETMPPTLNAIRLRAARLLHQRHPEQLSEAELKATIEPYLQNPAAKEIELLEVLPAIAQLSGEPPNSWLMELSVSGRSRAIRMQAMRTLAATGGMKEARELILLPEDDDPGLMRLRHETAERLIERAKTPAATPAATARKK